VARRLVVVDTSALIGLAAAGEFQLLPRLFGSVVITAAVRAEVLAAPELPGARDVRRAAHEGWLTTLDPPDFGEDLAALGEGEASVIALALQHVGPSLVVLDDAAARLRAEDVGLPVVGVLGVLIAAKRRGYLDLVGPRLERLAEHGFRVSPDLVRSVLSEVGEG
jgi:predicted nucleic acid-binding protein